MAFDLSVGDRFNYWTVISIEGNKSGQAIFQCDCGIEKSIATAHVVRGITKRCRGCLVTPRVDITGNKVGKLTVIAYAGKKSGSRTGKPVPHWTCRCECGGQVDIRADHLGERAKRVLRDKTCGCGRRTGQNYGWKGYKELSGQYWSQIQKGARERDIKFDISIEQAWELFVAQDKKCVYTGWPLAMHVNGRHMGDASLDRIDSNEGYVVGNIQWVHKYINIMKLDHSHEDFVNLCKAVAEYASS